MNTPIIQTEHLSFRYPGSDQNVLQDVNLEIKKGDFVAVMGSNGSGKSTLCKSFNGLIPHYYVGDFYGKVLVENMDTLKNPVAKLSRKVAYVYQDFENQLVRPIVKDEVTFAPLNYGLEDYKERGAKTLQRLGLEYLQNEYIWSLSGGQKHMVALAGVLSLDPEVIIIDEPVAQLDPVNAKKIYNNLKILNEQYGKTIIVIEHHTEFIGDFCKSVLLMDQGSVAWHLPVKDALLKVDELINKNIYPPQVTQAAKYFADQQNHDLNRDLPINLNEALSYFSDIKLNDKQQPSKSEQTHVKDKKPVVAFTDVMHGYKTLERSYKYVFKNLNLNLYEGDRVALVGSNGAGKSTIMKLITGLLRPKDGVVTVDGVNTLDIPPEQLAEKVAYIYQNPEEMFIEDNIRSDIEFFLKARKYPDLKIFSDELIEKFNLTSLESRDGRLLSGGQQRRASLAIGLGMRPSIVMLDEPTASLDVASRKEMIYMLDQLKDWVKTVVIATHDMQLVADWANRVIVLNEGDILKDSDCHDVFNNQKLIETATIQPPQIVELSHKLNIYPVALSVEEFTSRLFTKKEVEHFEVL